MKKIIKNLLLVIISAIFILFLTELVLFLSGEAYYRHRIQNKVDGSLDRNAIKILCLGDSNTFGMGADKGYSYPEQLERLLKERNQDKKFVVYNSGFPGNTSSRLLMHLEENLQSYRPDILIVLIGANDGDQAQETNYFLFKNTGLKGFIYRLEYYFGRFRVYRLFKLGSDILMANFWEKRLSAKYNNYFISLESQKTQSFTVEGGIRDEFNRHIEAGSGYWNEYGRKVGLALGEYNKAIAIMPDNAEGYMCLGDVYYGLNKYDLAIEALEKAMRINPRNPDLYLKLYQIYYHAGNSGLAKDALERYLYLKPTEIIKYLTFLRYGLPSIEDRDIFIKLLRYNLQGIVNIAAGKKIKLLLQNYSDPLKAQPQVQLALEEVALRNEIFFVNNKSHFQKLALQEDYKYEDYFNEDTHYNNKGYALMAENTYKVIIDGGFLP